MKKVIALILAALTLFSLCAAVTGCSNQSGTETETTSVTAEADSTAAETLPPEETVAVEDLSSNGKPREFRMLVRANRYSYLYVDDASTDPVEYSVYRRNLNLEEMFGIKFEITEGKGGNSSEQVNFTSFLAGAGAEYDLVCYDYWWNLDLKGYFENILEMPEINPEDDWWYQGWNDNVTIKGKMYSIAGDANLEMLENLEVMFFNKTIATDRSLDLYADVNSGNWTIERVMEVINSASSGLDDANTTNDVYGALYDVHSLGSQIFASGIRLAEVRPDGVSIDIASDSHNVDVCDALGKMMNLAGVQYSTATARARDWTPFRNGGALLYATALYLGKSLRTANLDFDYGILPQPKYNKDSDYISTSYGVSVFAIPVGVQSVHESALVLNALNFYSGRGDDALVTTFYDVVLKYQIADCVEDVNILDMVRSNVYIDFGFIYDAFLGLHSVYKDSIRNASSVASALKVKVTIARKSLEKDILNYYDGQ